MMIQVTMELKWDFNPLKMMKNKILIFKVIRKIFNSILMIIRAIMELKWAIYQAEENKNKL
jgi:hypothetical protein